MQPQDRQIGLLWVDLYALFGIPATETFRLQNKSSDWITIQAVASQPSSGSTDGIVLEPFGNIVITPDGGGVWARVTNDYIGTAIVTYHPITGIHDKVYTGGSGNGGATPEGTKADRLFNVSVTDKNIVANALTPVVTLRNNTTFQGKQNHVRARYGTVTLATDGQKAFNWSIFKNASLNGASFVQKNSSTSVVSYDTSATSISAPIPDSIGGTVMGKYDNARINLFQGDATLAVYPGETMTLAIQSAGNGVVSAFVRWIEEF